MARATRPARRVVRGPGARGLRLGHAEEFSTRRQLRTSKTANLTLTVATTCHVERRRPSPYAPRGQTRV